jgi:hypothetical protein
MATAFIYTAVEKVSLTAREIIAALATESESAIVQGDLERLLRYTPIDNIALRRTIAGTISSAGKYVA